ncbi:MAG: hypothetical protein JW801_14580 [Bacteroidales bacterium]|nr:hypothetical protein [Bacteroidales bacterium]
MIKKLLSLTLLLTTGFLYIQAQEPTSNTNDDGQAIVVINHKMIERFNRIEYDSTAMSFQDVIRNYTMEDVKLIAHSYLNGDFVAADKVTLDEKLAEMKAEMDHEIIRIHPLVTDNSPIR